MSVISMFSGTFCREEEIVTALREKTRKPLFSDTDAVAEAGRLSGMSEGKIERAFTAKTSVFNRFTHERERSIAHLKLALAERLSADDPIVKGFVAHLIPEELNHVLRICLIADMSSRLKVAFDTHKMAENEAVRLIHKQDEDRAAWVMGLRDTRDPWDLRLYDMLIPTDKKDSKEIIDLIEEQLGRDVVKPTERSRKAVDDFLLSARVEVVLVEEGHNVGVKAGDGEVTLTINKHVLMLSRLEEELKQIAGKVEGVNNVKTKVGPGFHQADIYRKYDFETPSKVLLVDDEREFVQTLSERLLMREMGSAVAYDGESALELIREDEPEVMILDLRMPGIDGIEVLRRVKQTNPDIEVIILTGHGSEADRTTCMELGAFAYLQKPVDIDLLSETIRKANEKILSRKTG
ncbi:MAG: response regulator [Deltaproteobacteria bacterium]|nr:response regulator [Deltaproteobacteria bacterium]